MFLSGCDVPILSASSGAPAAAPGIFETIVASTAGAALTRTALFTTPSPTSTWTPLPTRTPSLTPTPTPTFLLSHASQTPADIPVPPSASDGLDGCILISQTPSDGSHFAAGESYKVSWKVENTGSQAWDKDSVEFAYSSGAKMHKKQLYDLPADIPVGESATLNVSMAAPNSDGTYETVWSLRRGQNEFCHVNLTIHVP